MSCTFHYKFPLVSLGARARTCTTTRTASPPFRPAGIGKKERRIYRGTMASGQGKSECSLTARRILILVTHTYRRPEVENEWRKRRALPSFSSFPIRFLVLKQGLPTFSKIIWKTFDITYFIRHMRNEDCQALKSRRLMYKNTLSASTRGLLNLLLLCVYIYDILMHKYVSVGIFQRMKRRGGPVTLCSLPVLNCETIHKRL